MDQEGFSQAILLGIIAVLILAGAGGFLMFREKKMPSLEKTVQQEISPQKMEGETQSIQPTKPKTQPELKQKSVRPSQQPKPSSTQNKNIGRAGEIINRIFSGVFDNTDNLHQVTWAEHNFEVAQLRSANYKSDGIIEWTSNGFIAHDYSMPRTKLLDVNMNQKIKIKVIANMEGSLDSNVPNCASQSCFYEHSYPFAEFATYFVDAKDSGEIRYGIALLGTRDRIATGHTRNKFKFDWFTVENTGKENKEIIFEDSSGRRIVTDENSQTNHKLSELNQGDEWRLKLNSHVNGEGYTKLEIKDIQIVK